MSSAPIALRTFDDYPSVALADVGRVLRHPSRQQPGDERVFPHNLEAERSVLGAILVQNDALDAVDLLSSRDFYRDAHCRIFDKMIALRGRGEAIDLVTLKEELASSAELDEVGGAVYIASLVDGVPRSTNVEYYARIIRNKATLRRLIISTNKILASAYAGDHDAAESVVNSALRSFQDLATLSVGAAAPGRSLADLLIQFADASPREQVLGDLIALGEIAMFHGQPRDGKTWASLEVAIAAALGCAAFGLPRLSASRPRVVLIVSNEDSEHAYVNRLQMLLAGRDVFVAPTNIHLIVGQGCSLDDAVWQRRLIAETLRLGADLVILDPLRSLTRCVDQGPSELQPLAVFLRRFVRETGAALLLVHHDGKPQAGITDNRRRAQRASGGAIFSIVDSPMHVERVDELRSLVAPDGFKHSQDPQSFIFERVTGHAGASISLVATDAGLAANADEIALQTKIVAFLRENPGRSGRDITRAVRAHRQVVADTLERMFQAGVVDSVDGARNARLWSARP